MKRKFGIPEQMPVFVDTFTTNNITRYRFRNAQGRVLFVGTGRKEAGAFAVGYMAGWEARERKQGQG